MSDGTAGGRVLSAIVVAPSNASDPSALSDPSNPSDPSAGGVLGCASVVAAFLAQNCVEINSMIKLTNCCTTQSTVDPSSGQLETCLGPPKATKQQNCKEGKTRPEALLARHFEAKGTLRQKSLTKLEWQQTQQELL